MCLTTTDTPKVATKNIICYKCLYHNNMSYAYPYEYKLMKRNPIQPLGIVERLYSNSIMVERGYHSWKEIEHHGSALNYPADCVFMIPKGTTYIEGTQHDGTAGYVSEDIVFLGRVGKFRTKLRVFLKTLF